MYSRNMCGTLKYSYSGLAITEYARSDLQKGGNSVHSRFTENFAKATQFLFILSKLYTSRSKCYQERKELTE